MKKLSSNIVALLHILVWACFVGFFWIGGDNLLEELYQVLFYYILQPFSALIFGIRIGRGTKAPTKWLFVLLAILLGILLDYLTIGLWYRIYEQYSSHLEWFVGWFSGSGALIGLLYGTFCPPVSKWKHPKRWVTILAAILCVAAVAACAANPARSKNKTAGDPEVFRSAAHASYDAGETVTIEYHDRTVLADSSILEMLAAVDWQAVSPDGVFPSGMDCIKLRTASWTLETYSGTDYVRYVPDSGAGDGWLWWEISEENRQDGSLYNNLKLYLDQQKGIEAIPGEVSYAMYSYLETCKNHPESIPSHMHFEYADEQEAYEKSYRKIADYEILGAEKINDDLYAFTLHLEKAADTYPKRYYFVGLIDAEWCVMLNIYNIPAELQDGFNKDRFTLTSEDLNGGILVSPENVDNT